MNARYDTDQWHGGAYKSKCEKLVPDKVTQWYAGTGNSDICEIIDNVLSVGGFSIVRFVVEIKGRGESIKMTTCVLVEEGGASEVGNCPGGGGDADAAVRGGASVVRRA